METRLLELIASNESLDECLSALCASIPKLNPGVRASVLMADEQRKTFQRPIAPDLDASFSKGIEGTPINDLYIGTCGTAVYNGKPVQCNDIANDEKWSKEWRDLCVANDILACHSTPIPDKDGNALAFFVLCFDKPRKPSKWEYQLAKFCVHIASIALERERSRKVLRESREQLTEEVNSMHRLQEISTQMIQEDNVGALYEQILDAAVAIMRSEYASIQLLYPDRGPDGELRLLGFRGFNPEAAKFWELVRPTSESTCGVALRTGQRCVVSDVEECDFMAGSDDLETYLQTGIHAVQSTPLFSRDGQMLGMISTHWGESHEPSERDLQLLDVLARQATELMERSQAEKALRIAAEHDKFRAMLTDVLRPLEDPDAIKAEAARILGEHLGVSRAFYADVEEDEMHISVRHNYVNGVSSVTGRYRLDDFGRELMDEIRTGRTLAVSDVTDFEEEPRLQEVERDAYTVVNVQAYVAVPLVKNGKLVAYLGFHQTKPRKWADDEIALMEETAERTWSAVKRAWAENYLRKSRKKYRALFDSMDEGYCIIEMIFDNDDKPVDYRFIEVNSAFERQSGMRNVTGKRMLEFVPEIEEHWLENYGKVARTGEPIRFANEYKSLNRWFDVYAFRAEGWGGQRVAVLFQDITKQKLAQQAMRRSDERLRTVLEGSEVGAWDLNLEDNSAWRSIEHDRIFGYDSLLDEWTYEKFMEHVLPEDREMVDRKFNDALDGNGRWDFECRIRREDGQKRWIWVQGQVSHKNDDSSKRMLGTVQDITEIKKGQEEQKRLLKEVEAERERLIDIFQYAPSVMAILQGPDHVHEQANDLYKQLVGSRDLIGKSVRQVFPEFEGQGFFELLDRVYETGETYVGTDERVLLKSQTDDTIEEHYMNFVYQPIRDPDGSITGVFAQGVDLTERKRAEEKLKAMNETLEERVEERTSALLSYQEQLRLLATQLSKAEEEERRRLATELHDNLGQMLAVAKIKVDLIQKTGSLSDVAEASGMIDNALVYTRELMSDLKPPPSLGKEDINAALDWLAKKMKKYDLDVTFDGVEKSEPLNDDVQTTLIQVVRELLFNVVKHADSSEACIALSYPDGCLKIIVEDDGAGFDPDTIDLNLSKGGFGLFNIRERIDLLGGHTEIESEPGEGTKVTLLVPLVAEDASALSEGQRSRKPQAQQGRQGKQKQTKIKVLLVDDHQMMREGLKKIIEEEEDITVVAEASDGQSAVKLVHEVHPDVVIMDINLPGMNGIDATQKIKAELPEMRVIGLSLHDDEDVVREMRSVGASAYLNKSEAFETLCATIRSEGRRNYK